MIVHFGFRVSEYLSTGGANLQLDDKREYEERGSSARRILR